MGESTASSDTLVPTSTMPLEKKKQIFFSVNSPEVIRKNSLHDITGPFLTFSTSNGVRSLSVDLMLSLAW